VSRPAPERTGDAPRIGIVAARWNESIVSRLVDGARGTLAARGVPDGRIVTWWVPGSFELPLAARWMIARERVQAVLAFGCVIRGETEHFRLVADASRDGLMRVMLDAGVPVLNGVLAVEDLAQAEARAGGAVGNRGAEIALAALAMTALGGDAAPPEPAR
jgi:6,7-dimethyl-8-ribityllumazine synthase